MATGVDLHWQRSTCRGKKCRKIVPSQEFLTVLEGSVLLETPNFLTTTLSREFVCAKNPTGFAQPCRYNADL